MKRMLVKGEFDVEGEMLIAESEKSRKIHAIFGQYRHFPQQSSSSISARRRLHFKLSRKKQQRHPTPSEIHTTTLEKAHNSEPRSELQQVQDLDTLRPRHRAPH